MNVLLITLFLFNTPVAKINFVGNESIRGTVLAEEILSKKGDEYSDVNINFDVEKIIHYYETEGFPATVVKPQVELSDQGAEIIFQIDEGPRPKIQEIYISGADEKQIKRSLEIKIGDYFIRKKINESEDNIEDYYKDRGYPYVDVRSSSITDSSIIRFDVDKGIIHYVRNIEVKGLKTCNPDVVLREMELKKGALFSKSKLLLSQRNIYSLGFFSTISVSLSKQEPDSIDLIINIRELKSRILNFGIGLSIPLSFLISLGIEELNIFNLGHRFQVRPSFKINIDGEWEAKLEGRYTVPHITPMRITFSILPFFWFEETEEFSRQTRGNEFRISKLFTENIEFGIAHQYKYVDFRQKIELPDTIKGVTNSIKFQLMMDYRDEFFNPKRGTYILPLIEYAGGIFGGANHFVRLEVDNRLFIPHLNNTIAQRLKVGVIIPTDGVAAYEKYSLGGQYSLRGYPERSIGPDSFGDERYGNIIANYNFEYRITLPKEFGVVGFFDVGYLNNKIDLTTTDFLKATVGFGLRYYTPIGPIRADAGFPLTERGREIYLGIYHIF